MDLSYMFEAIERMEHDFATVGLEENFGNLSLRQRHPHEGHLAGK